jgi:murein DD-endopeptidase MepM/ murein hydrolase activator NlpD
LPRRLAVGCALSLCVAGASVPATAAAQSGGAGAPQSPQVNTVECVALPEAPCRPRRALLRGREFVIRGSQLEGVAAITFEGGRGPSDDVELRPERAGRHAVVAVVPDDARTGRLTVRDRYGNEATTPGRVRVLASAEPAPIDISPSSRFFFDSQRKPTFQFDVAQAGAVQVELSDVATGELVKTWAVEATPAAPNSVVWDGRGTTGVAPAGTYAFKVLGATASAATQADGTQTSFAYADHLFPIRGRHNLGYTPTNGFGGGRGHKGQDMFARCGTRLAAARGGRVEHAGYHSAAGNYVVIDGAATGVDYVYMHMRESALVRTGQRVFTGQKIGEVGETGRATGCHLHFEMWSAPGWYKGGKAFDPLPSLKSWDSYS